MRVLQGYGVNDLYNEALWHMRLTGKEEHSRNGAVLRAQTPMTSVYLSPKERVLFDARRDANPYFHLMEAMWMLAGREDVATMETFNSQIGQFSDDGVTLAGAYGHRWRHHFQWDQLLWIVNHLRYLPESRRAVLTMWDGNIDPQRVDLNGKDVPCNTQVYFLNRGDKLDMTVTCRSNDIIWGCYGANAVHFSYLHEFVALALDQQVGTYYHVSNDWHMYERHFPLLEHAIDNGAPAIYHGHIEPRRLLDDDEDSFDFLVDLEDWFDEEMRTTYKIKSCFIHHVLQKAVYSWKAHKEGDQMAALHWAEQVGAADWRKAMIEWLQRRYAK